jgi:hypothetical protein
MSVFHYKSHLDSPGIEPRSLQSQRMTTAISPAGSEIVSHLVYVSEDVSINITICTLKLEASFSVGRQHSKEPGG